MRLTNYITHAVEAFLNTRTLTLPCNGYELNLSDVTPPFTPDKIRILEHTTPDEFALAERYAESASLWDEYVGPDSVMDFDTASHHDKLISALLVIGQNR